MKYIILILCLLYGTNNLERLVNKTAKNLNIPLLLVQEARSIQNIENILNSGADKISINTAFIENPKLVSLAKKVRIFNNFSKHRIYKN